MARGGRTAWAPAITRLGINPYPWCTECIRGDVEAGPATAFPQVIGLAATFRSHFIAEYLDILTSYFKDSFCRI